MTFDKGAKTAQWRKDSCFQQIANHISKKGLISRIYKFVNNSQNTTVFLFTNNSI